MIRDSLLTLDHRVALLAEWMRRRVGYRGAALGAFATFDLVWAWSLIDPTAARPLKQAPTYHVVLALAPLWVWALGMAAIGVLLGVQAWMDDDRLAYAAAIGIKLIWATATVATWPVAHWQILRPTVIFLTLATLVSVCAAGLPVRE
ncbi:MAG TPA: hypothetical protein VG276_27835 [Actinomycetes bacterium]|jgi:hypothetical protein|nr:hypothetical protein [Actinomycetes bacterium]